MDNETRILCGGVEPGGATKGEPLRLNVWNTGRGRNIHLRVENLHESLFRDIPAPFHDLLEIAAYVYCCDQSIKRGGDKDVDTFGGKWRRRFHFHIPVRVPELWSSEAVKTILCETLDFLSDDFYRFTFHPAKDAPLFQGFFDLNREVCPMSAPQQVVMFSGGLDSLAGAIDEMCEKKRPVMLVNHRSTEKFSVLQTELQRLLAEKALPVRASRINVVCNKDSTLGKEYTQRSRSFLYAALGAAVSTMLGLRTLRFYENGVVSLNLPVCAQVVGGRATRTTHPRVLAGFQRLIAAIGEAPFTVENPFLWDTKGDVVKRILRANCATLIKPSRSCAHTWQTSNDQTHCGTCSQCIDRRFGMLAAGATEFDPLDQYKLDIFTQTRPKEEDKIMGAAYLERANEVGRLQNATDFIACFPEVLRVLRYVEGDLESAAERVFHLYKRHANEVNRGVDEMTARYGAELRRRTLPEDCLLRTVHDAGTVTVVPVESVTPGPETVEQNGRSPRYVFRKAGSHWDVVFEGCPEFHIEDTLGAQYLDYLFHRPNQAIRVIDLELAVNPDKQPRGKTAMEKKRDPKKEALFRKRLEELLEERQEAEQNKDGGRLQMLDEEVDQLEEKLGKKEGATDAGEQARNSVRKAIGALKSKLLRGNKWEKAFGTHVGQCVNTGFEVMYIQPTGDIWN